MRNLTATVVDCDQVIAGVVTAGDKGDKGDQGIQGIQGPKGDKGDQGDQGIQGIQGPKGDTYDDTAITNRVSAVEALLIITKETFRVSLGLSEDVPFSQYAAYIPWNSEGVPTAASVFDFKKNRYAKDGKAVYLDDVSEFIRLSSATMWQDGQLVEVANNDPRISGEGLLVEEQRTNLVPYSESPGSWRSVEADIFPRVDGGTTVSSGVVTTATRRGLADVNPVATDTPNTQHTKTIIVENISAGLMWVGAHWGFNRYARQVGIVMDFTDMSVKYVGPMVLSYKVEPIGDEKYSITITSDLLGYTNTVGLYFLSSVISNYHELDNVLSIVTDVAREFVLHRVQREIGSFPTSYIPAHGTPVTRSPDILNIPLLPAQTITGDWDEGVTYEVADNIATLTGHGYIRNITVEAL